MYHDFLRRYLLILLQSSVIALLGCSDTISNDTHIKNSSKTLAEEAYYQKKFHFIKDYNATRYLYLLNQQIQQKLSRLYLPKCLLQSNVLIVDRLQPFALTTTKAQILISSGLISKLNSEDELFFVLAHENSHIANCDLDINPSREQKNLDQELLADLVASNLLVATNRPISAAYSAINRLYEMQPKDQGSEHPSQTTRLKNLNQIPKNISYRLTGSNQQFLKFQNEVQRLSKFLE